METSTPSAPAAWAMRRPARDFFPTFFALDTYNSERVTFNCGPNAILFGLGSPSGVIEQTLKRARFRDSAQIMTRVDSLDGYRAQFDVNRVLIPKTLAIRSAVLYRRRPRSMSFCRPTSPR